MHYAPSTSSGRKRRRIPEPNMSISLTESAANRVRTFLAARGRGSASASESVRRAAPASPTSSTTRRQLRNPRTWCSRIGACACFVDPSSLKLIDGTVVDFVKQGLNEAFRFQNPNVKGECGLRRELQRLAAARALPRVVKNPYATGTSAAI